MATNIIERLFIEVGLDFSKLASEADKAIATSNKLEGSLSGTEKASGKANKALGDLAKGKAKASAGAENLAKGLTKAAKVLTGFFATLMAATGLNKLINEVQQANNELYFLEKNLGMSAQSIKSWQNAAAASGGTAEGMTATLKGLSRSMNDFVIMGDTTMLPYFNALGVSMVDSYGKVRNLDDVMLDLSDSLSGMDRKQAYSIGAAMGLDEGTLNTLLQGRDAMQEMLDIQNSMYHSSEKELEASRELSKQQAILNAHWESLKTMLANVLIPVLLKLTKVVNEWMAFIQRNERQVRHVFEMLSFIIGMILIPLFGKALMAALAFIAPFAPFILVVTALSAAFILLYDDYKTWAEGGKSLFDWGAFTNYINTSRVSVENLKSAFAFLLTGYKSWSEFAANGGIWKMLSDFADDSWKRVVRLWEALKKIFEGDFSGGFGDVWELVKESYTRPFERVAGAIDTATGHEVGTLAGTDVISRPKQNMYSMDAGVEVGYDGKQSSFMAAGSVGAGLGGGQVSVNGPSGEMTGNTLELTEADIVRIMKIASTEVVGSLKGQAYDNQVKGVVDTILNRTASGKYGKSVKEVANQRWAFSDINTPRKSAYGSVDNVPMSRVTPRLEKTVREHLKARESGAKSSVGDNVSYANPNFLGEASSSTKRWVREVEEQARQTGYRYGSGNAIHVHGTPKADSHKKPKPFSVKLAPDKNGSVNPAKQEQAKQMVNKGNEASQQRQTTNNNQKYVDVKIERVNVQSSSSTVSGTTGDAMKGVASNVGQLISGMS